MPMMELKPAPMYFKEVVFLKRPKGRIGFLRQQKESLERKKSGAKLPGSTNDMGYVFDHKSPQFHFTGEKRVQAVFVYRNK